MSKRNIQTIYNISTVNKSVQVNKHEFHVSREIIFNLNNRHYCTIWAKPQQVDQLVQEFLFHGQISEFNNFIVI